MANYNQAFNTRMGAYGQGQGQGHDPRYDINIQPSSTDTIPAVLVVDSSQRNRDFYENPGQYNFELIKPYRDVVSVELTQANIPNSGYAVNSNNNVITFNFNNDNAGTVQLTATLGIGNYADGDALASAIELALDTATGREPSGTTVFDVVANATTRDITVTTPTTLAGSVTLLTNRNIEFIAGQTNNADTIIGLGTANTTAASSVTLPYNYVVRPDRYIVLEIRGMERCDGNSNALMDCFSIIPIDTTENNFGLLKNGDSIDNDVYIHHFTEPLPKLNRLELTFRTPAGNIYDFNGRDHFLVFEIVSLSRPHKARGL